MPIKFTLLNAGCKDGEYYYNLGVEYYSKNKIKDALSCYEMAIKLNPDDVDALLNSALIKINQNDIPGACIYLKQIKEIGAPDADKLLLKYCK